MRGKRKGAQKARISKSAKKKRVKLVKTSKRSGKKTLRRYEVLKKKPLLKEASITNENKLKILVLTQPLENMRSDHNFQTIRTMELYADICYWSNGGSLLEILKQINMKPDFILHYNLTNESSFMYVVKIGEEGGIPSGYYLANEHISEIDQIAYIQNGKIDLIFTENHSSFAMRRPEYEGRARLLSAASNEPQVRAQQIIEYIKLFIENTTKNADVPQEKKLKVLILVKPFNQTMPKHQHKYDFIQAIEKVADVRYWHSNGNILEILKKMNMKPDFIFHYDIAWNFAFAPQITNLDKVKIPVGCYVMDVHWRKEARREYFSHTAKPDLIFSASKYPFLKFFPECLPRFRWSPFAINPKVIKDYKLKKNIKFSLLGLIKPRYKFRTAVLKRMRKVKGFINFKHPGHRVRARRGLLIKNNYAKVINRSLMSFTCGSDLKIPVAKFFELPGCKTLMLAEPNRDLKDLGFKDKVNYVACDRKNFYKKALYYQKNKRERERITQKGYDFIHKYHTNQIRAQQFIAEVKKVL
ncbi:glycosyltransferase family protein [Paenibacillus sp. LPE1-1-1.1]|uniref:glycosyltransferase family protein n=1 Tax=Paenibacillus sp. LPE1-1-1.1 TaxID=3135230 RepID=UPI0034139FAF